MSTEKPHVIFLFCLDILFNSIPMIKKSKYLINVRTMLESLFVTPGRPWLWEPLC